MTAPLTFTVPGVFPSLNVLLKWHWGKRAKHRSEIDKAIKYGAEWTLTRELTEKRVMSVDIVIYQPFRRLDEDNAHGSMKPVVDALRSLGLIYRDSPKWLRKTITQKIDRANPRVEITIQQVKEGK
jgi:Holliday junction resolvase RusA-like endonuclease